MSLSSRAARLAVALAAVLGGGACKPKAAPPCVVLISIDTLRADHLGSYGYPRSTSPRIDRLAAAGVRFENAIATSSWTLPSHVSMLSGLYPPTHGVRSETIAIPADAPLAAESFSRAGYQTAGFVSHIYLDARYGFGRGFSTYERFDARAASAIDRALAWIETAGDQRFFLFVHLFDPHWDYDPPPPYDTMFLPGARREMGRMERLKPYIQAVTGRSHGLTAAEVEEVIALYDGEIAYSDHQVGRLLDGLAAAGRLDNALVVVTSDHGEEFQDHGSMEGHQWTLYDEVIRVPLVFKLPQVLQPGRVIASQVQLVDVVPTILELSGIEVPARVEGRSLRAVLEGGAEPAAADAFADLLRFRRASLAVRTPRYKLIRSNQRLAGSDQFTTRIELFDIAADRGERNDLAAAEPQVVADLEREIVRWLRRGRARALRAGEQVTLDAETVERLRSLGYVQ